MKRFLRHGLGSATCVAAVAVGMTACLSTPPGYVAKEWSASMRELGINPIFPPREDVQVGDIYVHQVAPGSEGDILERDGYLPLSLWVGSVSLDDGDLQASVITDFYNQRPSFPETPTGAVQASTGGGDIFAGGDSTRLRLVGFPGFLSATFNKGDLSALIPVEAVNVALGGGFSGAKSVTVHVPNAESYGLPASLLLHRIVDEDWKFNGRNSIGFQPEDLSVYLADERRGLDQPVEGYITVITEVYYAREVDMSVRTAQSRGGALGARPIGVPAMPGGDPEPELPVEDELDPEERASALNAELEDALGREAPGGSMKFVAVSQSSIGMRRTFERPVAIGYRGVLMKVKEVRDEDSGLSTYHVLVARARDDVEPTGGDVEGPTEDLDELDEAFGEPDADPDELRGAAPTDDDND